MNQLSRTWSMKLKHISDKIKCGSILLYPYSHLSSNLETPSEAYSLLLKIEKNFKENLGDEKVLRVSIWLDKRTKSKNQRTPIG